MNDGGNFVAVLTNTLGGCSVRGVRGKTVASVKALLARAGCRLGLVSSVRSKRVPRGRAVAAEPRFGAFWPDGAEVDLVVSSGPKR